MEQIVANRFDGLDKKSGPAVNVADDLKVISEELRESLTGYVSQVDRKFKISGTMVIVMSICLLTISSFQSSENNTTGFPISPEKPGKVTVSDVPSLAPENSILARDSVLAGKMPYINRVKVASYEELVGMLKTNQLWNVTSRSAVPAVLIDTFPVFKNTDVETKKKLFLNTLLPVALIALKHVEQEREALQEIVNKTGLDPSDLDFTDTGNKWESRVTSREKDLALLISEKYRTSNAGELLKRVDIIPVSLIMAQGAIESSWGTSRFASAGNNLFGLWTWGREGIIPAQRDNGKNHKIAIYDTILDSVHAYILNLNRLPAYNNFRRMRQETMDSILLAKGLDKYSITRDEYVWTVRTIIHQNRLREYDKCTLVSANERITPVTAVENGESEDNKIVFLNDPPKKKL